MNSRGPACVCRPPMRLMLLAALLFAACVRHYEAPEGHGYPLDPSDDCPNGPRPLEPAERAAIQDAWRRLANGEPVRRLGGLGDTELRCAARTWRPLSPEARCDALGRQAFEMNQIGLGRYDSRAGRFTFVAAAPGERVLDLDGFDVVTHPDRLDGNLDGCCELLTSGERRSLHGVPSHIIDAGHALVRPTLSAIDQLVDTRTGAVLMQLRPHGREVTSVGSFAWVRDARSPTGVAAMGALDRGRTRWAAFAFDANGQLAATLEGPPGQVAQPAATLDGRLILAALHDGALELITLRDGTVTRERHELPLELQPRDVFFVTGDGPSVVVAAGPRVVVLRDGQPPSVLDAGAPVTPLLLLKGGDVLVMKALRTEYGFLVQNLRTERELTFVLAQEAVSWGDGARVLITGTDEGLVVNADGTLIHARKTTRAFGPFELPALESPDGPLVDPGVQCSAEALAHTPLSAYGYEAVVPTAALK